MANAKHPGRGWYCLLIHKAYFHGLFLHRLRTSEGKCCCIWAFCKHCSVRKSSLQSREAGGAGCPEQRFSLHPNQLTLRGTNASSFTVVAIVIFNSGLPFSLSLNQESSRARFPHMTNLHQQVPENIMTGFWTHVIFTWESGVPHTHHEPGKIGTF